jgi:oxalate decarboxylase/phosphoglucose isomerase-like protein (cupin superfamily)
MRVSRIPDLGDPAVPSKFVDPASLPTMTFDWGVIKPLVAADNTDGTAVSMMHVILLPGKGHDRHNHPESDEILYILAGEGDQMVDDGALQRVRPGDTVYIPKGAFHSTINTSYEPMVILAIYAPAGAEEVLKTLPDYKEIPGGEPPALARR